MSYIFTFGTKRCWSIPNYHTISSSKHDRCRAVMWSLLLPSGFWDDNRAETSNTVRYETAISEVNALLCSYFSALDFSTPRSLAARGFKISLGIITTLHHWDPASFLPETGFLPALHPPASRVGFREPAFHWSALSLRNLMPSDPPAPSFNLPRS